MEFNKVEFIDKLNERNNGIIVTDAVKIDLMMVSVGSLKIDSIPLMRLGVVEHHFIWGGPNPPERLILSNRYGLEDGLYQCKSNGIDLYAVGAIGVRSICGGKLVGAIWKINPYQLTVIDSKLLNLLSFDEFEITSNSIILRGDNASVSQGGGAEVLVRDIELDFDLNIIKSNVED
jgi:hypothetical protein